MPGKEKHTWSKHHWEAALLWDDRRKSPLSIARKLVYDSRCKRDLTFCSPKSLYPDTPQFISATAALISDRRENRRVKIVPDGTDGGMCSLADPICKACTIYRGG